MKNAGELTLMASTVDDCGSCGATMDMLLRQQAATAARPRRADTTRGTNEKSGDCD